VQRFAVNENSAKARAFPVALIGIAAGLFVACPRRHGGSPPAETTTVASVPGFVRSAYPILDVHEHLEPDATQAILALHDARNIRMAVNLSGGMPDGGGLEESLAQAQASHGRIVPFCNLPWRGSSDPRFVDVSVQILERCRQLGVRGLKIPKVFGLVARDLDGSRLPVDSARLDPIFEAAGRLGMVVLIHVADPRAFFQQPTAQNERYEELSVHPSWSFYGPEWPSWDQILSEFERRVQRHPHTTFIGAHFGNAAEDPERVGRLLEHAPNYYIDTAARIPEFGRHPSAQMRAFFERWQDRVLFGTDLGLGNDMSNWMLGSSGADAVTQRDVDRFFTASYRYFESSEASIENPTPIQGRWPVFPVGLSRSVLMKIYGGNAARLLHVAWPPAP
jgi:predicted TIM-barrel fold metal-dependent hydrolase